MSNSRLLKTCLLSVAAIAFSGIVIQGQAWAAQSEGQSSAQAEGQPSTQRAIGRITLPIPREPGIRPRIRSTPPTSTSLRSLGISKPTIWARGRNTSSRERR